MGAKVDARVTGSLLQRFASNQRVANNALSSVSGGLKHTGTGRAPETNRDPQSQTG